MYLIYAAPLRQRLFLSTIYEAVQAGFRMRHVAAVITARGTVSNPLRANLQ